MMRIAESSDLQEICALLREMDAENGVLKADEQKALKTIHAVLDARLCMVCEEGGQIVASLGLLYGEPFWQSSEEGYYDRWFYVRQHARGGPHAGELLTTAKKMARIASHHYGKTIPLWVGISSPKKTVRKMLFMEKYLTPFGGIFYYMPEAA